MKRIVWLIGFLICTSFLFGQQKSRTQLFGKVIDIKTGMPLPGASITLAESRIGTMADSSGNYLLKNVPLGHTLIEVSYAGYKSAVEHVDIGPGDNSKNFKLTSSIVENEAVTITAVGSATSVRKAPIAIVRVNKAELLSTPSTNIIDAISRQPGVSQLSTGPAISKPIIRGLGYNRLVVINDGVRQEGQQWGDEHGIEIDENSVSRVEIVKGPASLIYGSDALAGVINIITTNPVPVNTIKANLLGSYNTNNKQRSLFGSIGGNHNGFNWNGWGDITAAADYKNKYDGSVWNSKFNNKNFGGYVGYNGAWGFTHLIVSNFNQKLGIIEGERDNNGSFVKALPNGIDGTPTESDFNSADPFIPYQHIQHFKLIDDNSFKVGSGRISLNLAWQRNQRQEFGNPDEPSEKSLFFDLKTFNYNLAYHFNDKKGWATSIGIGGMQQGNQNKGVEVLIPEYDVFDIGAFVYTQKTIGKTTLSGGVRFDNRSLDSKELIEGSGVKFTRFKKDFSNISGSAGVSYAATQNFVLKLNLARGFRAPSIPELASNGAHEGTNRYEYGDQNLKSETSWQGDAGFEVNSEHILFNAAAFYNSINNFIFYSKLSSVNGGDSLVLVDQSLIPAFKFEQLAAHLAGFEAMVDLHPHPLDWLHWQNTISYVRGTFKEPIEGTKNVPFIPATRWLSELRAELLPKGKGVRNLSFYFDVDHTFRQNKPFTAYNTETATSAYTLMSAGISTNIVSKDKTLFSIYLLGSNLSDVAYQNHLSRLKYTDVNPLTGRQGVFNMGRNFSIKLNIPLSFDTK
ncbi:MAG TPA: TonB-dependent receptor [Flavisolibacter sp.]|nr:TonB-dependent receptor [Flavisolibacter sp.]